MDDDEYQAIDSHRSKEGNLPKGSTIVALFKKGDDLRKDQIVLQCFQVLDQLLLEESLNLLITAYKVLATGFKFGYLEFVSESKDLVVIHNEYSKFWDPLFSNSIINNFTALIKENAQDNEEDISNKFVSMTRSRIFKDSNKDSKDQDDSFKDAWDRYIDHFTRSMAGSIISSYILDLGDRHSGNLLVQQTTADRKSVV